jgi:uncharacterized repeat protein (TIGR03803 family)
MRGENIGTFHKFRISFALFPALLAIVCLLLPAVAFAASGQHYVTLLNFNGKNGSTPLTESLVQGTDGNLYGTTEYGGAYGYGSVFKVTPAGTLTTLYSFPPSPAAGAYPWGGLVLGSGGKYFYGTTYEGGTNNLGTIFKINSAGTLTILHNFDGTDGQCPESALVEGSDGNFYGVASSGGDRPQGTIFKITPGGTFTILHTFCTQQGCPDGANPMGAIVRYVDEASPLTFYGTTSEGGANNLGTVFTITSAGALVTLLSFDGTDGANPEAGLVYDEGGGFFGTTSQGGANNLGTVFQITSQGALVTLHSFDGSDGQYPTGGLVQATDGNFYGTTAGEADTSLDHGLASPLSLNFGSIFKITPQGVLTTLHSFCTKTGCPDGSYPDGGLVQRTNGVFFGVTKSGGSQAMGTLFSLDYEEEGIVAFVEALPTSGKAGTAVIILGTTLTGATSVTFNGKAAAFTVVSSSEITTTVPTGATTGPVVVDTPGGTLTSNMNFVVP